MRRFNLELDAKGNRLKDRETESALRVIFVSLARLAGLGALADDMADDGSRRKGGKR